MRHIYISYRRRDSAAIAGRIYDRLEMVFGRDMLFRDRIAVAGGANFESFINQFRSAITQSDVMIAIIGREWLNRLNDPYDFVRVELEIALERDIRVIPVLVDGAAMPRESELPTRLSELANRNAIRIGQGPDFDDAMHGLIESLHIIAIKDRVDSVDSSIIDLPDCSTESPIPRARRDWPMASVEPPPPMLLPQPRS